MTPSEQPTPNPFGIVEIIDWDDIDPWNSDLAYQDESEIDDYPFDDEEEAGDISW